MDNNVSDTDSRLVSGCETDETSNMATFASFQHPRGGGSGRVGMGVSEWGVGSGEPWGWVLFQTWVLLCDRCLPRLPIRTLTVRTEG